MAHLTWHGNVVRRWKHVTSDLRYHLTDTEWLLKTTGPRMGGAKVVARPKQEALRNSYLTKVLSDPSRYTEERVSQ